jgi:predicted glycoside hydrolase/deacetylase ChbG (UPF0249 family)
MSKAFNPSSEAIRLIIHADDWGQHPAVNLAIHSLIRERAITSASMLAGGSAAEEACHIAALHRSFCTGAHLSLSFGHSPMAPAQSVASLLDRDGAFLRPLSALEKEADPVEIQLELNAQIRFLLDAGIRLTHLDTHQGCCLSIHSGDEQLFPVILQLCRDYRLPFKLPRQIVHAPSLPPAVRSRLGRLVECLEEQGPPLIDDLIVPDFHIAPGDDYLQFKNDILGALSALAPGTITELTLHPAMPDEQMKKTEAHWTKREWEYRLPFDVDFRELLRERNIVLTSWSDLLF